MLMQVQSGLTRFEVKQQQVFKRTSAVVRPAFALRPIILLGLGLGVVLGDWTTSGMVGFALVALITAATLLGHAAFRRWLARLDAPRQVLVVRDGLARAVDAAELVAGDIVQVQAGTVLPADVAGTVAAKPSAWLRLIALATGMTAGTIAAGSRFTAAGQVQVVAVGADRLVVRQVAGDATAGAAFTLVGWLAQAALGLAAQVRLALHQFGQGQAALACRPVARAIDARLHTILGALNALATLVGTSGHDAKEAAFRYNQDPVSWRLA
ncbi:hypothetical protein [Lacticaseibacillus kribbianus]|uniref:hypothetical protein n=1 Tax=Lacticaseibacillus kribbianus TaxID=2926292 RepID=UPI001CD629F0|nr:hypothetical protein [Lacticaseibacillus kribbianus]